MQILSVSLFRFQPFQRALKRSISERTEAGRRWPTSSPPIIERFHVWDRRSTKEPPRSLTGHSSVGGELEGWRELRELVAIHTHGLSITQLTAQRSHAAQQGQRHTLHVEAARFGLWLIQNGSTMAFWGFKINLNELSTRPARSDQVERRLLLYSGNWLMTRAWHKPKVRVSLTILFKTIPYYISLGSLHFSFLELEIHNKVFGMALSLLWEAVVNVIVLLFSE